MIWLAIDPEYLGFIPTFISENDPRPAKEQFNTAYVSGWQSFPGHTFDPTTAELKYPDDPPLLPVGAAQLREELIIVYPYAWVLILQRDGSFEVARMD